MTPISLNPPSPFLLVEGFQDQSHFLLFNPTPQASSSNTTIFSNSTQQVIEYDGVQLQEEADKQFSIGGSIEHQPLLQNSLPSDDHHNIFKAPTDEREEGADNTQRKNGSIKWISSKMRLMRKMMNSDRMVENKLVKKARKFQDHQQPSPSENNIGDYSLNNTIRVCSDCNTSKTPLWRSGPQGPKSLCNACGIRQRKARRAIATAAAAANGGLLVADVSMNSKVQKEKKRSNTDHIARYKKRYKFAAAHTRKKLCFEDFTISLSKNSAFNRVFPQDEKDAAILLMALSCGLVRG